MATTAQTLAQMSIEGLARLVSEAGAARDKDGYTGREAPLSFAQERIWFMDRLSPANPFYNIPMGFAVEGALRPEALTQAWRDVFAFHDTLRASFPVDADGLPSLRTLPPEAFSLVFEDLRPVVPEERDRRVREAEQREGSTGFDLQSGPLARGVLIQKDELSFVILFTFHHSVFDGWSLALFLDDLFSAYAFRLKDEESGRVPIFRSVPISFAEHIERERAWVRGERGHREIAWWKAHLEDLPDLDLYADFPRPDVQSFKGDTLSFIIPAEVVLAGEGVALTLGLTPFMFWMSLYTLVLGRFSGQRRFAVGTSVSGRSDPQTEQIIGFFLNNLVIKADVDPDLSWKDYFETMRRSILLSFQHQDLPFQFVAESMGRNLDLSKNPVFQAGLTFQNIPAPDTLPEGLCCVPLHVPQPSTHLDIELLMWPAQEGNTCFLTYATDIFSRESAARIRDALVSCAWSCLTDLNAPLRDTLADNAIFQDHGGEMSLQTTPGVCYPCLSPGERLCLVASKNLNSPALIVPQKEGCASGIVTFAALWELSLQAARELRAIGTEKGTVVAVMLPSGPAQTATMLGVWIVGGVLVPLDPDHPTERNAAVLRRCGARVLAATSTQWDSLQTATPSVSLDLFDPSVVSTAPSADILSPAEFSPSDIACILHTSGSTGEPKGIALSHRAVAHRWEWMWRTFPWHADDRACQKTSPLFVDFLWEVFGALFAGVPVVQAGHEAASNVQRMLEIVTQECVTRLVLVPSYLEALRTAAANAFCELPRLREIISSGEPLPPALAGAVIRDIPGVQLLNLYGSTEIMDATCHVVDDNNIEALEALSETPLGLPIDGSAIAVLDEFLRPVPRGRQGMIYTAGPSLAQGYCADNTDRTNSSRENAPGTTGPPHSMGTISGTNPATSDGIKNMGGAFLRLCLTGQEDLWFRTGDLGVMDEEGCLYYRQRSDQQIKIRGVRVEPEVVRAALLSQSGVEDAVVMLKSAATGPARLAAFVLPRAGSEIPSASELRVGLARQLPAVMVPTLFHTMVKWPRTPSGKIDRQELLRIPDPDVKEEDDSLLHDSERTVRRMWGEVLGVAQPPLCGNFFESGGNSLLLVHLHERLQREFGKTFPLTTLFHNPTVESQAAFLRGEITGTPVASEVQIESPSAGRILTGTGARRLAARNF